MQSTSIMISSRFGYHYVPKNITYCDQTTENLNYLLIDEYMNSRRYMGHVIHCLKSEILHIQ